LKIAYSHFKKLYKRVSSFDRTVIDGMLQHPEDLDHDQLPTIKELNKAVSDMASLAVSGESGLSPMAIKNCQWKPEWPYSTSFTITGTALTRTPNGTKH
jgi:hypothetical protein